MMRLELRMIPVFVSLALAGCGGESKQSDGSNVTDNARKSALPGHRATSRIADKPTAVRRLAIDYIVTGTTDRPIVTGTTNLPDNTHITVLFTKVEIEYSVPAKGVVSGGKFRIGPVTPFGKALPSGNYEVEITTPGAAEQPTAVFSAVGPNYRNYGGPLFKTINSARVVSATQSYRVARNEKSSSPTQ